MHRGAALTGLLAAALLLAAACSDAPPAEPPWVTPSPVVVAKATPTPTSAPMVMPTTKILTRPSDVPRPSPTPVRPTPTPVPTRTPGPSLLDSIPHWPSTQRTGLPGVDRVLDAYFSGEPWQIDSVLHYYEAPCIPPRSVSGKYKTCRPGEPVGTIGRWLTLAGTEEYSIRDDEPLPPSRGPSPRWELLAVCRSARTPSDDPTYEVALVSENPYEELSYFNLWVDGVGLRGWGGGVACAFEVDDPAAILPAPEGLGRWLEEYWRLEEEEDNKTRQNTPALP